MDFSMKRLWGPTPRYPLIQSYNPPSEKFVIIAGPCSVETPEMIAKSAATLRASGATHLRGGVFRAGTYPGKNFGYVDRTLIEAFKAAANSNGMRNIIEILNYTPAWLDAILPLADCVQIGCRQMQNYTLLKVLGSCGKPVFLKRHPGSTMDEWLGAAEYILEAGCRELYLIERGSSTHLNHVRWDLSISLIPAIKAISNVPVICDASHGTGRRDLVKPMALAGIAAGAAGILTEVHESPNESLSDPDQAITPNEFQELVKQAALIRNIVKGN